MKKIFLFLAFVIAVTINCFAQEPGNNLGKSLSQIKQSFPNLVYLHKKSGYDCYKSAGDDDDFTCFTFDNGKVVGEYTYIFDYMSDRYITDLYNSFYKSFSKSNAKQKRSRGRTYDATFFYYSDFIIKIANYENQFQLFYELKGYNIEFNALQSRSY